MMRRMMGIRLGLGQAEWCTQGSQKKVCAPIRTENERKYLDKNPRKKQENNFQGGNINENMQEGVADGMVKNTADVGDSKKQLTMSNQNLIPPTRKVVT